MKPAGSHYGFVRRLYGRCQFALEPQLLAGGGFRHGQHLVLTAAVVTTIRFRTCSLACCSVSESKPTPSPRQRAHSADSKWLKPNRSSTRDKQMRFYIKQRFVVAVAAILWLAMTIPASAAKPNNPELRFQSTGLIASMDSSSRPDCRWRDATVERRSTAEGCSGLAG